MSTTPLGSKKGGNDMRNEDVLIHIVYLIKEGYSLSYIVTNVAEKYGSCWDIAAIRYLVNTARRHVRTIEDLNETYHLIPRLPRYESSNWKLDLIERLRKV